MSGAGSAIMPAASLIVMRPGALPGAPAEILFVERAASLRFGGGAWAFPGGRIEPEDARLATRHAALDPADATARIAAIRETWEEAGVAIGMPVPGLDISTALATADLSLLRPFARWLPPADVPRRFDTRFYVTAAPPRCEARADGGETARVFWASAATAIDDIARGNGRALFPTRRLLDRLATFADAAAAAADRHATIDRAIETRIEHREDGDWLCIPADAGYPVWAERLARADRS